MIELIEHPHLFVTATFICIPLLFPLARFFFEDFEAFKKEIGLDREIDRDLWLLGYVPSNPMLYFKMIGIVGVYAGAIIAVYQVLTKIFINRLTYFTYESMWASLSFTVVALPLLGKLAGKKGGKIKWEMIFNNQAEKAAKKYVRPATSI